MGPSGGGGWGRGSGDGDSVTLGTPVLYSVPHRRLMATGWLPQPLPAVRIPRKEGREEDVTKKDGDRLDKEPRSFPMSLTLAPARLALAMSRCSTGGWGWGGGVPRLHPVLTEGLFWRQQLFPGVSSRNCQGSSLVVGPGAASPRAGRLPRRWSRSTLSLPVTLRLARRCWPSWVHVVALRDENRFAWELTF